MTTITSPDIRARRRAAKLSLETLAHLAGCSASHLRSLEHGYQFARSDVLERVLATLDELEAKRAEQP